jgi:hypothetical protein
LTQEGPRRLLALINGLPSTAATWREDQPGWTQRDEWAAQTVEGIYLVAGLLFNAHFKGQMPDAPRVFDNPDRPGGEPKPKSKPRLATPADLEAYARQKEGGE